MSLAVARLRFAAAAISDIASVLDWTRRHFGPHAQVSYERLLSLAFDALATEPLRPDSAARPEFGQGIRSYHLRHSRKGSSVARPRHIVIYRVRDAREVEIGRVLHEAMELARHAAFDGSPNDT